MPGSFLNGLKIRSINGQRKKVISQGVWKDFVISHPTGNTFVRPLIKKLNNQSQLEKFFTTIGAGEGANFLVKLLCEIKRQYAIPDKMISRQWIPEFARFLSKGDQAKKRQKPIAPTNLWIKGFPKN